jgi:hypothetical protein
MNETLTNKMPKSGAVIFDHEKLAVYRLELGDETRFEDEDEDDKEDENEEE